MWGLRGSYCALCCQYNTADCQNG